ncbi:MAG: hypothetical protein ACPGVJ_08830, partial [Mangrovicoccus sp.]
ARLRKSARTRRGSAKTDSKAPVKRAPGLLPNRMTAELFRQPISPSALVVKTGEESVSINLEMTLKMFARFCRCIQTTAQTIPENRNIPIPATAKAAAISNTAIKGTKASASKAAIATGTMPGRIFKHARTNRFGSSARRFSNCSSARIVRTFRPQEVNWVLTHLGAVDIHFTLFRRKTAQ